MSEKLKKFWPLILAEVITVIAVYLILGSNLSATGGKFIYAFDDSYIQLSIAKNFALHGVWGVTPFAFSSSSSSLAWPIMEALLFKITGVSVLVPFFLNFILALVCVALYWLFLEKTGLNRFINFLVTLLAAFSGSVILLVFSGMEHILQICTVILFLILLIRNTEKDETFDFPLILLSFLAVLARYEGLFLVFSGAFALLLNKRYKTAAYMIFASLIPVIAFGIISLSNGWHFLPSSVLFKSRFTTSGAAGTLMNFYGTITNYPQIFTLSLILSAGLLINQWGKPFRIKGIAAAGFTLTAAFFCHLLFARVGNIGRYEAYLVSAGLLVFTALFSDFLRNHLKNSNTFQYMLIIFISVILAAPFFNRIFFSLKDYHSAVINTYEQNYQVGRFAGRYYTGKTVIVNDIGAINFYGGIRNIDLFSLGSNIVEKSLRAHNNSAVQLAAELSENNPSIAVVHEKFLYRVFGSVPKGWYKAGEWKISDNIICGDDAVSFYAFTEKERDVLAGQLIEFSEQLPAGVKAVYYRD